MYYKNRFYFLLIAGSLMLLTKFASAQTDPHFTQSYTYPLYINPAFTGTGQGEDRVSGVFRNQWGEITNPYRTVGISYDRRTQKNISFGFNMINQTAGDAGFGYLTGHATAAYNGVKLGERQNHRLVFAIQAGFLNRRIDPLKFRTGEQWNPITGYNASAATGEEGWLVRQSTVPDIGAGVLYFDADGDKRLTPYAGFSAFHLNRPRDPFVSRTPTVLEYIPVRYSLHGGLSYNLTQRSRIVPNISYMKQGTASELLLGTYVQLYVDQQTDFMFGAYYRMNDAVAPYAGVNWKDLMIGLSYDVNASRLGRLSRNVNAFELSISYSRRKPGKDKMDYIRCPRM